MTRLFRSFLGLFIVALLAPAVLFSQESPTDVTPPVSEENTEKIADAATLNLHRWGAVTLFHGLPSDRVNAIAEDANGALWFGTDSGLVRYDGRRTELVGSEGAGGALLPSRRIRALKRDAAGGLWIGTDVGAARFSNNKITPIAETQGRAVTSFAESPQGTMALTTEQGEVIFLRSAGTDIARESGRFTGALAATKLDRTTQPLLGFTDASGEARGIELTSIVYAENEAKQGEWWFGSRRRGALVVRERAGQMQVAEVLTHPPRPYFISAAFVEGGNVWFGAQAGRNESGLWSCRVGAPSTLARVPISTGRVTAMGGGGEELWVGTDANGAYFLRSGEVVEHVTFENTAGGLRSNHVNAVFRDREGVIWFGTDRGVSRYDRDSFRATNVGTGGNSNFVWSLLLGMNGDVWAGTNRGLYRLDGHDAVRGELGPWEQVTEIGNLPVYTLLEDKHGTLWVGTEDGLFTRMHVERNFHALPQAGGSNSVRELLLLEDTLYARMAQGGLVRVENERLVPASVEFSGAVAPLVQGRTLLGAALSRAFHDEATQLQRLGTQLPTPVQALLVSGEHVWLGTGKGLFKWERGVMTKAVEAADVQALIMAKTGVYCATKNAGLYKLSDDGQTQIRFDTEQGLASQQVFALADGEDGAAVWIGTNRGVVCYQPSPIAPRLEARRLVADQVYDGDYLTAELRFPSTQTSFLLEVAALGSRTFPSQFQYEYTLEEKDRGVVRTLRTPEAQFVQEGLKPGLYTITVRALSRDLVYSEPLKVRLWIARAPLPWTSIFLAMLLGVAVVAGAWAYRSQRRTARANLELEQTNEELREARIRLARETEAERSRIARDLHDQTLGDLRHLLVLTDQLPAPENEDANAQTLSPTLLRKDIEEISREIRQICEDLSPSVLENIGFVPALEWALTNAVAQLPADEKFNYQFIAEPDLEDRLTLTPTERIQLYRIVQEALNNVCRHARAKNVTLSARAENGSEAVIVVKDDGVGLSRTADGDARVKADGSGHGMANIRSRANLIGAQVAWLNTEGGCTFEVRKMSAVSVGSGI